MGRVKKLVIQESEQELLGQSRKVTHPVAQARLRALYLYKSGLFTTYEQIAGQLGYERHAVGNWFGLYREKGLAACLQIKLGG